MKHIRIASTITAVPTLPFEVRRRPSGSASFEFVLPKLSENQLDYYSLHEPKGKCRITNRIYCGKISN